jgi:hypothetical protein
MNVKELKIQIALGSISDEEKMNLVGNPCVPPEILLLLSKDKNLDIRYRIAGNLFTSPEILLELSKDKNGFVRWRVACNPNTPPEILIELNKEIMSDITSRKKR